MRTMADVARHAGVSVATVSHVLNATRPVRPATRDAVLRAIDELGYIHNTLARSLVTSRTHSVGLAVSAISNPYFTEILQGVEAEALATGYGLLIADPHDDPGHELSVVRMLHERRVDGVIIAPSAEPSALLAYLDRADIPAVFLDRLVDEAEEPAYDQVCADGVAPVRELVGHLAALGHRRIALVAGLAGLSTTTERVDGYRQGLDAAGLPFDPALLAHGHSASEGARHATERLLASPGRPTAVIAANNAMTIGALQALRDAELRIPEDVALVSFDDFEWADLFSPSLTAVRQPSRDLGGLALRLLLERLDTPGRPTRTVRLPCTLVHRTSCGCPPGAAGLPG
ncbi:LacI family transcriptional regulator [Streptomyces seoulensis]|uniref:LacI family transcriptional regulator n=1 Tax=Streptomyces seoulensis TaxID=73044 RepID=A0A4V0ZYY6_STRSO|nr:LacI family DNA-binding transcriptional regulator [Streptomyces seoulensis]QBJ89216.1 LacI family transcriptional regulator [Streptomyces seoulensis]